MRAPQPLAVEMARERRGQHDPRRGCRCERGVADVGREQHLVVALAGQEALRVDERAVLERRVDHDLVLARPAAARRPSAAGRSPSSRSGRRCGRGSRRAASGSVKRCGRSSSSENVPCDRDAVVENVQVRVREVDDAPAVGAGETGARGCSTPAAASSRRPACRSARSCARAGPCCSITSKRLAHAVAGEAAAEREELGRMSACISSPASAAEGSELRSRLTQVPSPWAPGRRSGRPSRARAPSARRSRRAGSRAGAGRSRAWSRRPAPARGSGAGCPAGRAPACAGCGRRRSRARSALMPQ